MERVAKVQKGWVCLSDLRAEEIHRAWILLRAAARQFQHVARVEGWLAHTLLTDPIPDPCGARARD